MAFVQDPNDPNNPQNQPQSVNNPMNQPPQTASGIGAGAAGVSSPQGSTSVPSSTKAPPFTDLGAYLKANAPQTQDMASKIAGNLGQQANQVSSDIASGQQAFEGAVKAGSVQANPDLISRAVANPSEFVTNPTDLAEFQREENGTYTGPQNFESSNIYGNLSGEIQKAATNAPNPSNPNDFGPVVQSIERNPTAGMTALDTLLLQENPEAASTVNAARAPFGNFSPTLQNLVGTEDQGVQAAQTATASTAPQVANALQGAGTSFTQALNSLLSGSQSAFSTYNADVGQLKGQASDINTAIQDYLRANPNVTVSGNNNYLAPWLNLSEDTVAPTLQTVAGQGDYATAAALEQLGGSTVPLNLPISGATADQAGKFALPQDLGAAISNQDVTAAMKNELMAMSGQLTAAYKPYGDLLAKEMARADVVNQANAFGPKLAAAQQALAANPTDPTLQKNAADLNAQYQALLTDPNYNTNNYWPQLAQIAQGIGWVPQASTQYNDLVSRLQADLGKLGGLDVPTMPARAPAPNIGKDAGNAAGVGIGVGAPVGAATGLTAAGVPITASELAASGLPVAGAVPAAGLSGVAMLGPAALAGYGASNIAQNAQANPIESGLATLANTGLSLATLSLPPSVLNSIGKGLNNVINSIGDFFGGLF